MVDVLDRVLLQIVVRRMALVGDFAAYKRQHGLRIRDVQREREILVDRCERAEAMRRDVSTPARLVPARRTRSGRRRRGRRRDIALDRRRVVIDHRRN